MATSTPFTYNNGSTIPGTEQIGDLSVGLTPQDYSSQPGGKIWWMGPDEDSRYVIGKDVPTQDHPTPVGNVGSVKFWATSTENDTQFIDLTNSLGGQTFTTVSGSLGWLSTNGYWTNYLGDGSKLDSYTFKNLTLNTQISPGISIYDSSLEYFVILNTNDSNNPTTPVVFTANKLNNTLDGTLISGSDIFLQVDSSGYANQDFLSLTFKESSNELFALSFDSRGKTITNWDLTTNTSPYTGSITQGTTPSVSSPVLSNAISYSPKHDLIYGGSTNVGSNIEGILIYSASSISNSPDASPQWTITGSAGFPSVPVCHAATDNSGKVFIMQTIDTQVQSSIPFAIMSGSEFIYSGSFNENIRSYKETTQVIYDENSEKWYFTAVPYDENGFIIISLDANTYEFESNVLTTYNQTSINGSPIVYDENRDVLWTYFFPRVGESQLLYAISPTTLQPIKSELPITPTFGLNYGYFIIDPINDNLHYGGIVRWSLNDFWPI